MADIVLCTLNARYIHAAFGLRYLKANLGELESTATILEFDLQQTALDVVEAILAQQPRIVGFGIYIWNLRETTEIVAALKRLRPGICIVVGGPEVSYEWEGQPVVEWADYLVTGEADLKFAELCRQVLRGERPMEKVHAAPVPALEKIRLPYRLYNEDDVKNRIVYVEASRGCPFACEFCLSSLEIPVRAFPIEPLLEEMNQLIERGVRQFKFVDRTFNLNLNTSRTILEFFLDRIDRGLFVHFEMIPDRLPESLREIIARFPAGTLQFEVGIQSFNADVSKNISRRQDLSRLEDNFRFLLSSTGVHLHADLIVGLPGENLESFARGFDRLVSLGPQEIQVGILKRLRGTPIVRHDGPFSMVYHPDPPYEILQTRDVDFESMQRMRRFARYWDLVANSGNFPRTLPLLWKDRPSPFQSFLEFSEWLYGRMGRRHGIALARLAELLLVFLVEERQVDRKSAAESVWSDYQGPGRRDMPGFLQEILGRPEARPEARGAPSVAPRRQKRHLARSPQS